MKWKKAIGILLFATFVMTACTNEKDQAEEEEEELITPVETSQVEEGTLTIEQTFFGRVTPDRMAQVIPQNAGEISELNVENGDEVEANDVIARTSPGNLAIEAPIDGTVQDLNVDEDSLVSNQEPMATVIDLDSLNVSIQATSEQLDLFEKDQEVTLNFSTIEDDITGTIDNISVKTDDTGLYPITATVKNEEHTLKPGMVAKITIPEDKIKDALIVPTEAIIEENDKSYIYVIQDNTAHYTEVEVLGAQTESTAIKGDVEKGAEIVTRGQLTLTDGGKVEVMKGEE
ncbi:RND family efflux transporter, MFP subunit [Salinibacillus kushneri]|uniref:RND family efflux transporter, MFP subunit n=1 Tax=Salinibacillus kushneri TaxID=237682 RepID=A0A1I0D1Z0_9BACI|nr:efflux RND transporter periplasmic adaptor subunit [Salinibacillus kushneri]SET25461.1 RND family efflux transporter, MFP subunit [Salinibacillus kushneri]